MKRKRWRKIPLKPGFLIMQYGRDDYGELDLVISRGAPCEKRDGVILYSYLCTGRGGDKDCSLIDNLIARGYDITTLKFSIQKKEPAHEH